MKSAQGAVTSVSSNGVYSFTKPVRDQIVLVAGLGVEGDSHAGVHVRHRSRVRADPTQPNLRQVHLIHEELFGEVAGKGFEVRPGNLGENVTTRGIDLLGLPVGTILRFGSAPSGENGAARADGARAGADAGREPAAGAGAAVGAGAGTAVGVGAGAGTAVGVGAGVGAAGGAAAVSAGGVIGGVLAGVLAAADAATLDESTARAAAGLRAAVAREAAAEEARGVDSRPALVVAGLRNPCGQINGLQDGLLKELIGHDGDGHVVRKGGIMTVVLRGGAVRPGDAISVELPPPPHVPLDRI